MKIFVYIQEEQSKINTISLEAIQGAQKIAEKRNGSVSAITFNQETANALTQYNLSEILYIEDPKLRNYNPLYYLSAMEQISKQESPDMIIVGHTYEARDWVPRLSARLDIPFISDCIAFEINNDITFVRSIYQGKFNANYTINNKQSIISFQSGAFKIDTIQSGTASVRNISIDLSTTYDSIKPGEKFQESAQSVDLSQANIIVSVGRGIGKEENLPTAKNLAAAIGGELASSRPIVDAGWLEPYHQVGSSGQTVAPTLYLALGISGAIQHVVGMKGAKNIVVINKDPNAPLFEIADYGVVGDIFEIIPKLTELLQNT